MALFREEICQQSCSKFSKNLKIFRNFSFSREFVKSIDPYFDVKNFVTKSIECSNSSICSDIIWIPWETGNGKASMQNAAASVKRQIASPVRKSESACQRPIPLPIRTFFSMEKGRQARGEERKERKKERRANLSAWSRNDCTGSPRLGCERPAGGPLCLLPPPLPSFLSTIFDPPPPPPPPPPSCTRTRHACSVFAKPVHRSRDLRGDRRDPRSRSIRCARIPANRSPFALPIRSPSLSPEILEKTRKKK